MKNKIGEVEVYYNEDSKESVDGFPLDNKKFAIRVGKIFKYKDAKKIFVSGFYNAIDENGKRYNGTIHEQDVDMRIATNLLNQITIIIITDDMGFEFDKLSEN